MATQITINAVPGGFLSYPIVVPPIPVQLDIVPPPGGGVIIAWTLLKPRGSTAVLSNPAIQNPTFNPDVEGTYRLELTLDGVPDDGAELAVPQVRMAGQRIPAQGETTEAHASEGWAIGPDPAGVNDLLKWIVDNGTQGGFLVARAGEPMAVGQPVAIRSRNVLKSGLPGQESIPNVFLANASSLVDCVGVCGMVVKKLGAGAIVLGDMVVIQTNGPVLDLVNTFGHLAGETVWLSDVDGVVGWTPGTIPVSLGTVITPIGVNGSIQLQPPFPFTFLGIYAQNILPTITEAAGVSQYDLLTLDGHLFDATDATHMRQMAGIAAESAAVGASCIYWADGAEVINAGWAWTAPGVALYADPATPGGMTETPPAGPAQGRLQVGIASGWAAPTDRMIIVQREPLWIP